MASTVPSPIAPPSAPQNLTATAGNGQIILKWSAPINNGGSAITGYKIYRGYASGAEILLATKGNVLTCTHIGLTNGVTYYYKVSTFNSAGEGLKSNEASAKPATVPAAPILSSATPGNAQVTIAWSAPAIDGGSSIAGYKIYRGTTPGGEVLLSTLGKVLAYTETQLINGHIYYYKVSAVNSVGEGAKSNELSATPYNSVVYTVPAAPTLAAPIVGNAQITLTWSAPASNGGMPISAYKVYRGTLAGGETLLTTLGNVLTYTNTGLTNGQIYYYRISAVNSVGEGAKSNEVSARPAALVGVPSAPQNLVAIAGNAQITIAWSIPVSNGGSSITGYKIYRSTTSGQETLLLTIGNVLSYTNSGLTNGQVYYYKVSAVNSIGEGAKSNEASGTPSASVIPAKITVSVGGSNYNVMDASGKTLYTSTNAATAINKAFGYLTSGRTIKEKVVLQGSFTTSGPINIPSYTLLEMAPGAKIKATTGSSGFMITASGKSNIEIVGGEWDGNRAGRATTTNNNPFNFLRCTDVIIRDLYVHDGCYDNIEFESCDRITISKVESGFSNWDSMMMAYTSNSIVQNCNIHDSKKGGLYFYCEDDGIVQHVDNNIIRNNTVARTMTSGLSISLRGLEDIGQYNLIENNTCIDCGIDGEHPGINLGWSMGSTAPIRYANHCTVQNNLVYETGAYNCGGGLLMQCMNSLISGNIVHDTADVAACIRGDYNTFVNNQLSNVRNQGTPGLVIWDGNSNNILNNVISNIKSHGIWIITYGLTSGCNYNNINGNTISGVAEYWVVISNAGSKGNIIELNTLVGAKSIYNAGTGTIIRNNK